MPYYKKVDRSMMDWGFTVPQDHISDFLAGVSLRLGKSRSIQIIWDKKEYFAKLSYINRKKASPVYQIRWDNNKELLKKVRKTFIQSYVILKSQKELFDIEKKEKKHFRTQLEGGQQEVIAFQPISSKKIKAEVFIRINNEWNTLFQRLADENVFGWIFDKTNKKYLVQRSTNWIRVADFKKHQNVLNVIYYLVNIKKKLLYIGKAEVLGKRVKPGRRHQNMPRGWNFFKYDIIKPEFANVLERIEDHTIRSFASILKNDKGYPSLNIGNYKLVNSNWKKL
jgi:hypothetical protein